MGNNIWQGERIRLRGIEPEDWRYHYEWDHNTDDARKSYWIPPPTSKDHAQRWAQQTAAREPQNDHYHMQIETLNGEFVGSINTVNADRRTGTFGYGLAVIEAQRRKGYASEAVRLVLRYFFEELRYQKCTIQVYSFNEGSIGLHRRLGFVEEGRLRRMVYTGGQFYDTLYFGITAEEFATQG